MKRQNARDIGVMGERQNWVKLPIEEIVELECGSTISEEIISPAEARRATNFYGRA